jgi:hypothetical protein
MLGRSRPNAIVTTNRIAWRLWLGDWRLMFHFLLRKF